MTAPCSASHDDVEVIASSQPFCIPQDIRSVHIKVAVRLCPFRENDGGPKKKVRESPDVRAWSTETDGAMISFTQKGCTRKIEGRTVFHFDQIFDEETETPLVYQNIAKPMVPAVLSGKHATIFAYGQTGAGKTFTMQGGDKIESDQAGIIQLVTIDLFEAIRRSESSKTKFEVKVSYFEIYNEKIRDLIADNTESASSNSNNLISNRNDQVNIRTNAEGEIIVNVEQKKVDNADEALTMLVKGNVHRTVAATDMNAHSSRSHSIFRLIIESRKVDELGQEVLSISDFNLVDLAGSESLKATKTTGIRQREGATINKSLLALTTVIQALSQPIKKRPKHINYRDSKLTRILQPHLSGNAEMAILCCASPYKNFMEETRSTLKFASRAKLVQIKPKINRMVNDDTIIKRLQNQLCEVRKRLEQTEQKLQETLAREPHIIESALIAGKTALCSSDRINIIADEKMREPLASTEGSQSNSADTQRGLLDSFDPNNLNSSQDTTANSSCKDDRANGKRTTLPSMQKIIGGSQRKTETYDSPVSTEDDSFDGSVENCVDFSLNICSQVSNPETIYGIYGADNRGKPVFRPQVSEPFSPNGRLENNLSWDAMALTGKSVAQSGRPLRAIESLNDNRRIPDEITIIKSVTGTGDDICFTDRLKGSEARIKFLEENLELSDDIIEESFRDLQRARQCIRDLVQKNIEMGVKLSKKGREDQKKNYEKGEIMVEQYWILKVSLYGSVFFFISGSQEYFLASAFFVWLALEMNVTA